MEPIGLVVHIVELSLAFHQTTAFGNTELAAGLTLLGAGREITAPHSQPTRLLYNHTYKLIR